MLQVQNEFLYKNLAFLLWFINVLQCTEAMAKFQFKFQLAFWSQGVVLHSCIVVSVCNSSKFSYQQSNIDNICLVLGLFPSCVPCAKDDLYWVPTCHFHVSLRWRIEYILLGFISSLVYKVLLLPYIFTPCDSISN